MIEWIEDNLGVEITFPVIADPMGDVSRKLGMAEEGDTSIVRNVFIIDDQGIIRMILVDPKEVGRNIQEIYRAVKALQISDEYGVALPANWPKNELIGSDGIIPPASSVQQIENISNKEKTGEVDCYDWWFCYKSINNNGNNKKMT